MSSTIALTKPGLNGPPFTAKQRGLVVPKNPYIVTQRSPLIDPPENAYPFLPNGSVTIPAIGSSAVICSGIIPPHFSGVIWRIANATNFGPGIAGWTPGDGTLVWQVIKNNQPYQFFPNIIIVVGLTELNGGLLDVGLRLHANDKIALIVNNISLSPSGQLLVGSLSGYIYPQNQDPQASR